MKNVKTYYEVSGERLLFKEDSDGRIKVAGKAPRHVRLSTLFLGEAEAFAGRVYRREKILLEIHEIDRRAA